MRSRADPAGWTASRWSRLSGAVVLIAVGVAVIVVNVLWLVTAFEPPLRGWFTRPAHVG